MANVNVKFGATVSSFTKAMQQSRQELKQLQSEMGVTKTQSKLFGDSMDNLSKKQYLLQKSSSALEKQISLMKNRNKELEQSLTGLNKEHEIIKNKIKEVEKAYQESVKATGEDSKASQALKKELNSLNKEYTENERQIKNAEKSMANNNTAINNNTKKLMENKKSLDEVNKSMANMKIEKVSNGFNKVSETTGKISNKLKPVATGIIGVGAASAKMSLDFEDSFAKVISLTGQSGKAADNMKKGIIELSSQTGISCNEIAEQVYQAVSAGQSADDALKFVKSNAMLAKTGFTDLGSAVDMSSTILNAWGLKATDVAHVSNVLNITQDKGKTTIGQLAQSMGQVASTASMYKVNIEQVSSAYAALTKNGIDTQQSGTAINGMLSELGKSGTTVSDVLKQKTGKSFSELMGSGKTLTDVLKIIDDEAKKNGKSLGDMFSNKNAIKGAATLSQHSNDFSDALKAMGSNTNITEQKMKKLQTTNGTLKKSFNDLKIVGIQLGDTLSPAVDSIAKVFRSITSTLKNMSPETRKLIVNISLGIVAITGITKAISKVTGTISGVITGFNKLKNTITTVKTAGGLLGKIGGLAFNPWVLGITAVVGTIVVLWNKCSWFRNAVITVFNGIKQAFNTCINALKSAWNGFKTAFMVVVNFISSAWSTLWNTAKTVFNVFVVFFKAAWEILKTVVNVVVGFIKQIWQGLCTLLKAVFGPIIEWIKSAWNSFKNLFNTVCNAIKQIWNNICNSIKSFFTPVINFLKNLWNSFKNTFNSVCNGIKNIWNGICNVVKSIFNGIVNFLKTVWNGWKNIFSSVANAIKSIWNGICNSIKNVFSPVVNFIKKEWEGIKNAFNGAKNALLAPFTYLRDKISGIWHSIRSAIKLPHFKISGEFSLSPPSIPHIGVDWYWNGGIIDTPTVLGNIGVGDSFNGHGNNAEAIVPLDQMYRNIENIIQRNNNNVTYLTVNNTLDSKIIGQETFKFVDGKLATQRRRVR